MDKSMVFLLDNHITKDVVFRYPGNDPKFMMPLEYYRIRLVSFG